MVVDYEVDRRYKIVLGNEKKKETIVAYISCIDNSNHLNMIYLLDQLEFENQVLKAVPYAFTNFDYNYKNYVFYNQTNAVTRFNEHHYPVNKNLTTLMALAVEAPISYAPATFKHTQHGGAAKGRPTIFTIFYLLIKGGWG